MARVRCRRLPTVVVVCVAGAALISLASPRQAAASCAILGPATLGDGCPSPTPTPTPTSRDAARPAQSQPSSDPIRDDPADASRLLALTDGERGERNLTVLGGNLPLQHIALRHAGDMAESGRIYHNASLFTAATLAALGEPDVIGENVGRGWSIESIHRAFMDSPSHRANVLEPDYVTSGIAVVTGRGQLWVVEAFMSRPTAAPGKTQAEIRLQALQDPPSSGSTMQSAGAWRWDRRDADGSVVPSVLGVRRAFRPALPRVAAVILVIAFGVIAAAGRPRRPDGYSI